LTFSYGPDRAAFWDDYVDRVGWGVDSEYQYERFLEQQDYLGGLFNIWSDPNAPDWAQSVTYQEFWAALAEFGLDSDSFDWHTFREKYRLSQ